jgi:hypothetical protein
LSTPSFEQVRRHLLRVEPGTREFLKDAPPAPKVGHANLFVAYPLVMDALFPDRHIRVLDTSGFAWTVNGQFDVRIFNEQVSGGIPDFLLEVADADYAKLAAALPDAATYQVTGFTVPDWKHSLKAVSAIEGGLAKPDQKFLTARITMDLGFIQLLSTMMFAGFFVSILFFLACAAAIYFRLQSQSEADKRQFLSLWRIGLRDGEADRILTLELMLLFFTPVLVGLVHSTVAMVDFSHLLNIKGTPWPAYMLVAAIYVACAALCFAVARMRYVRHVATRTSSPQTSLYNRIDLAI